MSGVSVKWSPPRCIFCGPARSERTARDRLAQVLYEGLAEGYEPPTEDAWEGLSECEYLHFSQLDEKVAGEIAEGVKYKVHGNRVVIKILWLEVTYQNPGKPRKFWARVVNGRQTVEPGDLV